MFTILLAQPNPVQAPTSIGTIKTETTTYPCLPDYPPLTSPLSIFSAAVVTAEPLQAARQLILPPSKPKVLVHRLTQATEAASVRLTVDTRLGIWTGIISLPAHKWYSYSTKEQQIIRMPV